MSRPSSWVDPIIDRALGPTTDRRDDSRVVRVAMASHRGSMAEMLEEITHA
jgi:hypothetical protein